MLPGLKTYVYLSLTAGPPSGLPVLVMEPISFWLSALEIGEPFSTLLSPPTYHAFVFFAYVLPLTATRRVFTQCRNHHITSMIRMLGELPLP